MTTAGVRIEQKQVEGELQEARAILRNFYDTSPFAAGVIEIAEDVVLALEVNNAAARLFTLVPPANGKPLLGATTIANAQWAAQCRHCHSEELPVSFEYEHAPANSKHLLSVIIASLDSGDDGRPRFTFVIQDIGKQKRWNDEIMSSRARLSDILENISDGFLAVNYQWEITYANRQASRNSEYEHDELTGRNLWEAFPELINTQLETDYRRTMTQRIFRNREISWGAGNNWYDIRIFPSPEGISIFWTGITERKLAEENLHRVNVQLEQRVMERTGELALMVSSLQAEVEERRRAEQQLLQLNRLYAVLSETTRTIVHTTDRNSLFGEICRVAVEHGGFKLAWIGLLDDVGIIRADSWSGVNDGFLELFATVSSEQLAQMPATGAALNNGALSICNDIVREGFPPWRDEAAHRGFGAAASIPLRLHRTVIGAFTLYAEEPGFFSRQLISLLHQLAANICFALDNVDMACRRLEAELKLARESEERLKAMEQLHQRERMLMEQNRHAAMGEMVGNIAHQWRQPLNSLALLLQRIPLFYEAGRVDLQFLENNVQKSMELINHMSQTIDDFRNFFRPEKCRTHFRLADVVAKAQSLVEATFMDLGITMQVSTEDDPIVDGYPNDFSQILLNILINARDAFLEREDISHPHITIRLGTEGAKTVVTVTDNAGGIPDEIMPNIFDPYFTTKGPDKGTGIGLHMAKTIIEKNMNGMLTVRNTGNGAEFKIEV
ncbi:ATP-binding protein [Geotalea sp. SG265]|uniref:PAS domain-containing sensor histidine kinase n=1 Tax=Geotalea sp. SG265 TaxID=2922867 RepID=UPI001FAF6089|nr:ATP-binding protein [Geotalea sp. SG265]